MPVFTYVKLYQAQQGRCFYCNTRMTMLPATNDPNDIGYTRDHFLPWVNGHTLANNVVMACKACNNTNGWTYMQVLFDGGVKTDGVHRNTTGYTYSYVVSGFSNLCISVWSTQSCQ